jgi:DNA-directed RNA polymerase subunit beta'
VLILHAFIKVKANEREGWLPTYDNETTVGRVLFNQVVPEEVGYINELLTKKSLRDIIGDVLKNVPVLLSSNSLMISKILDLKWPSKADFRLTLKTLIDPC